MSRYSLAHLADHVLLRDLGALVALDRATTADLLAHLAEVDARKLYLPAGYASLFAWCVGELGFSEDCAWKRIQSARAAREFPQVLGAVSDGRLHLSAVVLLAPHLTRENAAELLAVTERRSKREIEELLAARFPRPDVPALIRPIVPDLTTLEPAPGQVAGDLAGEQSRLSFAAPVEHREARPGPDRVEAAPACARVVPLSSQRYAWQLTATQQMQDDLQRAKELLGHAVPGGDMTQILARALRVLVRQEERRKCAATDRPHRARTSKNPRHIPAHVRREVWRRDGGRCTFVGESGHRCEARSRLEFDHIEPVARGGQTTVANLRLRCRAHNQFAAERAFGKGFMDAKRRQPQYGALAEREMTEDVISALRTLGVTAAEARRIASLPDVRTGATLEGRILRAVQQLGPPSARRIAPA